MKPDVKRLYRSVDEGRVAGICAGLGEYVSIDPVVIRLGWVAVTVMTGIVPGALAYLVAWIIVPPEPVSSRPVPSASEVVEATR
jgi:phage shock protein C